MKIIQKVLIVIIISLISCSSKVTIDSKFNSEDYKSDLFSLTELNLYNGVNSFDLCRIIDSEDLISKYQGKTYKEVIPDLVSRYEKIQKEEKELEERKIKEKKERKEEAKKKLKSYESKFRKNKDEFSGTTWYTHKNYGQYGSPDRKTLIVHLNNTGYSYLESKYYSSDWVFHTFVKVKVGDKTFQTKEVKTYDKNNVTDNYGGNVWEQVSYLNGGDNGIIKAIALNPDKKVLVRYEGSKYYGETTLSKNDKIAIKESYEFSNILKSLN